MCFLLACGIKKQWHKLCYLIHHRTPALPIIKCSSCLKWLSCSLLQFWCLAILCFQSIQKYIYIFFCTFYSLVTVTVLTHCPFQKLNYINVHLWEKAKSNHNMLLVIWIQVGQSLQSVLLCRMLLFASITVIISSGKVLFLRSQMYFRVI